MAVLGSQITTGYTVMFLSRVPAAARMKLMHYMLFLK